MSQKRISHQDMIIAVMGPTGAGKSTVRCLFINDFQDFDQLAQFIEYATRQDGQTIGHGLTSCTADIRTVRFQHPDNLHSTIFVDTPGFDDTRRSDTEILGMIANWLMKTYKEKVTLAGILYFHRISDNRMAGSPLKNLNMFASLCGERAMQKVILVTTMWGQIREEIGERRERELKSDFWSGMLSHGCTTQRFRDSYQSAWDVVTSLPRDSYASVPESVLIPKEIVDDHLRLNETQAGITLFESLQKLIKDQQEATERIRKQAGRQDNELLVQELNVRKAEIDEKIENTLDQLRTLKIPFFRKLRLLFKAKIH